MSDPSRLSLSTLAHRIASGRLSSFETVSACLERIARLDTELRAWVTLAPEQALDEAAECDRELSDGNLRGALHGVPLGIKDIFDTAGITTGMGSPLFAGHVPAEDAVAVRRLRSAGAIVLGKTATTEFASLDPGPTRNPWNRTHTPGGSSSGSAAAVAARMCPATTGTQTAGSIGRPAAFCGVVGMMPTAERIPRDGVFPAAWSLDHVGGFGRSVDDVRILTEVMSETRFPDGPNAGELRFGVVGGYFREHTNSESWRRHETFVRQLAERGFDLVTIQLPELFEDAVARLWTIMRAELAAVHRERFVSHAEALGSRIRDLIEDGLRLRSVDYVRARGQRRRYQEEMRRLFRSCDVLVSPGAPGPAPEGLETTGDPVLSAPWTLADFPTLSLPIGLDANGMPLGIQLSAPPFGEARLFDAGRRVEDAAAFDVAPIL